PAHHDDDEGGDEDGGAHRRLRGLDRPRDDPRQPGQPRAESEDAREHAVDVDAHARGHLGVEHAGADDGSEPRPLDEEPEDPGHHEPEAITNIRYDGTVAPQSVTDPENRSGGGIERIRPPQIHLTRSSN